MFYFVVSKEVDVLRHVQERSNMEKLSRSHNNKNHNLSSSSDQLFCECLNFMTQYIIQA